MLLTYGEKKSFVRETLFKLISEYCNFPTDSIPLFMVYKQNLFS